MILLDTGLNSAEKFGEETRTEVQAHRDLIPKSA